MELSLEEMLEVYRVSSDSPIIQARAKRDILAMMNAGLSASATRKMYEEIRDQIETVYRVFDNIPDCEPHTSLVGKVKALIARAEKAEQYVQALQKQLKELSEHNEMFVQCSPDEHLGEMWRQLPEKEYQSLQADAELGRLVRKMPGSASLSRISRNVGGKEWAFCRALGCDSHIGNTPEEVIKSAYGEPVGVSIGDGKILFGGIEENKKDA